MDETDRYDAYFAHSHQDAVVVEKLAVVLVDSEGLRIWLDRWDLVPGGEWQRPMAHGIDTAQTCAVFIGSSTPKGWFRQEIQRALNRQTRDLSFRVIPVLLPGSDSALVDDFLELRTWVDFRSGMDDELGMHMLIAGIRGRRPGRFSSKKSAAMQDNKMDIAMKKLRALKEMRENNLVADDVLLEFQRKIVDRVMEL